MKYEIIIEGLDFPEGPTFDSSGNLWFVEILGGTLCRFDGETVMKIEVNGTPNGAVADLHDKIWFCDSGNGEIRIFDPILKRFEVICNSSDEGPLKKPNDLIFDRKGNLLFTDHGDGRAEPLSTLCVLPKGENEARVLSSGKFFTNGLALRDGGTTLCYSETYRQKVWIAGYDDKNLLLKNERVFTKTNIGKFGPDGMVFHKSNDLYVTIFDEQVIHVYNPEGKLISKIKTPGKRPTSCAFDPYGKYGLVVTEAEKGLIVNYPEYKNSGLQVY